MEMGAYQSPDEAIFALEYAEKLEQVRDVLVKIEHDSRESLVLVDTIQRLGLCYLFNDEIEAILHQHFLAAKNLIDNNDLYKASLSFRLLRQQGYQVHADEFFMGFKGDNGEFKSDDDLFKGVLALYEASHLSMEGETILHEAAIFSVHYLSGKLLLEDEQQLCDTVTNCLLYPHHKTLSRFRSQTVVQSLNRGNRSWEKLLQELAHFEFAAVESIHKHEILQVVKWWKGLHIGKETKLSLRDQPQKWHMWSMAVLLNPNCSKQRILLTKPISLVYAVDDIFDLHGTINELTLFTDVVNGWDISAAEKLPSYMETCFLAIHDTVNEISSMISQRHGFNPTEFLRKEWGNLFKAFLVEAKWFISGELPKAEEYLKNGVISSGVPMVLSHLFSLMGYSLTKETQILLNDPHGLTFSVAKLLRLLDDLGSAKDEDQEGYDGSYVECYMKEESVDSLEAAREHVMGMVSDTWQDLNKHGLSSTSPFSAAFRQACLNAARMVLTMYNYDENHRLPLLEQHVKSVFHDATLTKSILG